MSTFTTALEALLFEADPMGISFETNADEYRPEAETIAARMPGAQSVEDVQTIVHQEFVDWFGKGVAPHREYFLPISEQVWKLWQAQGA